MALDANSTEAQAWTQYWNNVEGWRTDVSKASALVAAIEWLMPRHRASKLQVDGRQFDFETMEPLRKEAADLVNRSTPNRTPLFSRANVTGMGRC